MRHRAKRIWWRPWRTRCACGCAWFPCPDAITINTPGPDLRRFYPPRNVPAPPQHRVTPPRNDLEPPQHASTPPWNAPTTRLPTNARNNRPFLTRGQQWRTRRNAR